MQSIARTMKRTIIAALCALASLSAVAQPAPAPTVAVMKKLIAAAPTQEPIPVVLGIVVGVQGAVTMSRELYGNPVCIPTRSGGELYELVLRHVRAEENPALLRAVFAQYAFMVIRQEFPCADKIQ